MDNIGQELVILFGFPYDRSALNKLWITQIFCHKKKKPVIVIANFKLEQMKWLAGEDLQIMRTKDGNMDWQSNRQSHIFFVIQENR